MPAGLAEKEGLGRVWAQGLAQQLVALQQAAVDDAAAVQVQDVEHDEDDLQISELWDPTTKEM